MVKEDINLTLIISIHLFSYHINFTFFYPSLTPPALLHGWCYQRHPPVTARAYC